MILRAERKYPSQLAACLVLAAIAAVAGYAYAQPAPKPFTKDNMVKLLAGSANNQDGVRRDACSLVRMLDTFR